MTSTPHDALVKATFSQVHYAADEFRTALPSAIVERLDLDQLQLCSGSFVDDELRAQYADLLYAVPLDGRQAFVYLLLAAVATPHDALFKSVFGDPRHAAVHMERFLPTAVVERLDLEALTLRPGSFVDQELREHHADLLFEAPFQEGAGGAFLYLLFEHQSSSDPTDATAPSALHAADMGRTSQQGGGTSNAAAHRPDGTPPRS